MHQQQKRDFPRPGLAQAAAWLGADFFGLARLLLRNKFRVRPSYLPDCLIDVFVSLLNTGLGGFKRFIMARGCARRNFWAIQSSSSGTGGPARPCCTKPLALDRRHRCPTTMECFCPNHFLLTQPLVRGTLGFLLPGVRPTDNMEMGWDHPQEDEFALCNMGIPSPYATMAFPNEPPQFPEYLDLEALAPAELRRWKLAMMKFLKALTYQRSGRLVLKSPPHTFRLPTLLAMFPKACFLHVVRNPYVVFASTVRLWKSLYAWQGYQKPVYAGLEEHVLDTFVAMHERLDATRKLVDPARFHEIRYEDLLDDPVRRMRGIYEHFGLGRFEGVQPAIRAYFADRADYRTNRHELPPEAGQGRSPPLGPVDREVRIRGKVAGTGHHARVVGVPDGTPTAKTVPAPRKWDSPLRAEWRQADY